MHTVIVWREQRDIISAAWRSIFPPSHSVREREQEQHVTTSCHLDRDATKYTLRERETEGEGERERERERDKALKPLLYANTSMAMGCLFSTSVEYIL